MRIVTGWSPPGTARSGDERTLRRRRERQRFAMLPCSSSTRYFNELDVPAGDLQAGGERLRKGIGVKSKFFDSWAKQTVAVIRHGESVSLRRPDRLTVIR